MLPNKARGVPRVDGRRILNGIASALTFTGRETWSSDSFNRIRQRRRIATSYDKLTANDLAFGKRASVRLWRRAYESTPWSSIHSDHGKCER